MGRPSPELSEIAAERQRTSETVYRNLLYVASMLQSRAYSLTLHRHIITSKHT